MVETYPDEMHVLPDGTQVVLRAIRRDDAPRLQALVLRLSPQSLYWRANTMMKVLSDADARRLVLVDYERSMAIVAARGPQDNEEIIGVARYVAPPEASTAEAEVAVVVEDSHQGEGLGSLLITRLAGYARGRGIHTFTATVSPQNEAVARLIRGTGLAVESREMAPGERYVRIMFGGKG